MSQTVLIMVTILGLKASLLWPRAKYSGLFIALVYGFRPVRCQITEAWSQFISFMP